MSEETEDITYPTEEIEKIIMDAIDAVLLNKTYDEKLVQQWINQINQMVMEKLVEHPRPFKFFLNTLIMQRKGANVIVSNSNYWDTGLDQSLVIIWPKEKAGKAETSKQTIQCMVSVYAVSILNSLSLFKNEL